MKTLCPRATAAVVFVFLSTSTLAPLFAGQSITEQIDGITARPVLAGNTWSIYIENAAGNLTYYQQNPTLTQAPASNMKNITAAGAFGLLGITNSFVSQVYRNGTFSGGVVTGDINLLVKHDITWNNTDFSTAR